MTLAIVVLASILTGCWSQERKANPETFYHNLLVGGAYQGKIYIELPLKPEFFTNATTREQKAQVWQSFFERAIREKIKPVDWLSRGSQDSENGGAPYWGEYVLDRQKVDDGYIAKSVEWQIGDRIHIRSENGAGTAKITRHSIHYSPAMDGAILLAVAEPEGTFEVKDTHLLVVSKEPFSCRISCSNHRIVPDQKTSGQILDVLATGLKKSEKDIVTKFAALRGSFTKHNAVQYVAYIRFLEYPDYYWRTAILDSDLSIIKVLGENDYAHIVPISVGDVEGDGLDEIWTELLGSEGYNTAIFYLTREGTQYNFKAIATMYNGD